MNEKMQPETTSEATTSRNRFWGTITLNSVMLMVYSYVFTLVFKSETNLMINIAIAVLVLSTLTTIASLVLSLRHRLDLGMKLTFFPLLAVVATLAILFQGRAISSTASVVIITLMGFFWLFPRQSWRSYLIPAAVTVIFVWVFEWIDPAWRVQIQLASIGPIGAVTFAVILGVLTVIQAWPGIRRLMSYSIRNRLTALILVVTIPLLIGITAYISSSAGARITSESELHLQEKNDALSTNLSTWLEMHTRTLTEMAALPDIVSMDPEKQIPILKAVAMAHPNLFLVHTVGLDGMNVARNDEAEAKDYSDRLWFLGAKNGNPITYEVLISRTTGRPALNMSMPIRNSFGQIVGVVSISSELNEISQDVIATEDGGILAFIVDEKNFVVAHPNPSYTEGALFDLTMYPPLMSLRGGQPGAITFKDEDGVVWRAFSSQMSNGWVIVTQQPQNELLLPVRRFQVTAGILIVLGAVTMFLLAWFTIRRTLQPISALTQTVTAIAEGDLKREVEVTSQDEIGELASAFAAMTAQVRGLIGTLEQRVADRTRGLELAADVGRSVSQVRELNLMLRDAAELIRTQFDLYYTQVYLINPAKDALLLQAGTGTVGQELVGRRHSLPLNINSINGRAAIEKHPVVIADTETSDTFRPNPLLPDTRSEMAVPLMVGETVVGVLDMQSASAGALNEETLAAYQALAGQLAVAIQNANLLAETEQARAEVETRSRQMVRTNWKEYLDAIHKPENLGFVYEANEVAPITESNDATVPAEGTLISAPIALAGESLGTLTVETDSQTRNDRNMELVNIVARQVAQQIENLRLLDSAERYRFEAEEASRRMTREGWKDFKESNPDLNLSYFYNLNEVQTHLIDNDQQMGKSVTAFPLMVRDEQIGKLIIKDLETDNPEALELVNQVTERLSEHIETLRQFDQTQSALAQSEKLFEASRVLTQASDLQELTASTVKMLGVTEINRAVMVTMNYDAEGQVESLDVIANWWNGMGIEATPVGTHYPFEALKAMAFFISPTPVFFGNTFTDERADPTTLELAKKLNLYAVAVLPLHISNHQIGALILEGESPHNFTNEETRLFTALAPQIATVLENRRQFTRAQQQAEREGLLNTISQKIQSATTVEAVLQIAARELGRALGAPMTIAQLGMKDRGEA